jgi:DNA-binding IclR family transcriptional regulator
MQQSGRGRKRQEALANEPPSDDGQSDRQGVQVLARAGEILRLLKVSVGGLTQAEMAGQLGLARTTVHRLLNALAKEGLVQLSGAGSRYRLGAEILHMAEAARAALLGEAHPLLVRISRDLEETADLSILDRTSVTFVDQVVALQRLRAVSAIGASFPLHCTANGKAILAALPPNEARRLVPDRLEALTPNTITSRDALMKELEKIRSDGFAVDLEEHSLGICAVGVSIGTTPLGAAALSVPIPMQRFEEKQPTTILALKQAGQDFRAALCG